MRRIRPCHLTADCQLAIAIRDKDGRVLVPENKPLGEKGLEFVLGLGAPAFYVLDDRAADLHVVEAVRPETRAAIARVLKSVFERARAAETPKDVLLRPGDIAPSVNRVLVDLSASTQRPTLSLAPAASLADYPFVHAVNTAVMAARIGLDRQFNDQMLRWLVEAALLHDIGETRLPEQLLSRPGPYRTPERGQIAQHPTIGYQLLKQNGFEIPPCAAILQHHERWNGSGYPQGRAGAQVYELARIIAVAEVYDALISERPHRPAYAPHYAHEYLMGYAGELFDIEVVKIFTRRIPAYDCGVAIKLDSGEEGIVVRPDIGVPGRPVVRLWSGPHGEPLDDLPEVDLTDAAHLSKTVVEVVD